MVYKNFSLFSQNSAELCKPLILLFFHDSRAYIYKKGVNKNSPLFCGTTKWVGGLLGCID
jgi:hypothetical protein